MHVLYSGLGGHGNVFFSMVGADEKHEFEFVAVFFGIEDVRDEYVKKAEACSIPWFYVKKKPGIDFEAYKKITNIILEQAPDVIFLHSSAYIFPARKAVKQSAKKMKIVVRETQANHLKTKQEWLGLCAALLKANRVVFLSNEYRDAVRKKLFFVFSNKKTTVIPNGIDLHLFSPAQKQGTDTIRIGMLSRLTPSKDHVTLIHAFAKCLQENKTGKKIELHIAGEGESKPALQQLVSSLNLTGHVFFAGLLDVADLPAYINKLDIYVHATLGETMSTAIMQVMACRVPIIASDVLGVNNMVKDKQNGLLVQAKNELELCKAIWVFINDPVLAQTLATNAFNFATENYSNKKMLQSYKAIFNS